MNFNVLTAVEDAAVSRFVIFSFALMIIVSNLRADGPGDNLPDKVRRIPPPGIKVPDDVRTELQKGVDQLGDEIAALREALKDKPGKLELLPDVQVFHKGVHDALKYDEFYDAKEFAVARKHLQLGMERAKALRAGEAPWNTQTGLVVRGYKSKIDDSIQPYGLVVPPEYKHGANKLHRLDFWAHGRGEKLTELSFIQQRLTSPGEFTPKGAFVLHLYGRYCCANKFAGEIDLFEAYENARKHYSIDPNRLVMRGFSMGGAAAWQFAVHYSSFFCAAAPGAGFSETPEFLRVFQNEQLKPTWYEQKLWNWYDCPGYAMNLFNLPTVAYSGENDPQKQAADVMAKAFQKEQMTLTHIIGPKTGHSYHKDAKVEINKRIDAFAEKGRDPAPKRVQFATYTLRYNRSFWIVVDGLEEHWTTARIEAELAGNARVQVATQNVSALTLNFAPGTYPLQRGEQPAVWIDESRLIASKVREDGSWTAHFRKMSGGWQHVEKLDDRVLRKRHGLQGPIDDAFLDRFVMVKPTGEAYHTTTGKWADAEMQHAIDHWRRQFRGEAIVKKDTEITDDDIKSSNLVVWGDPSSNKVLARILDKLPLTWNATEIKLGDKTFAAGSHMPAMIFPNPLNPKKYVVLNSGFTFREYDYLNNARQVPKLPDWAIIDVTKPVTSKAPGGIADAGFFDEEWKFKARK